jgi:CDP-glycerol glycerophosphotransferase (TagB/SpsB family)
MAMLKLLFYCAKPYSLAVTASLRTHIQKTGGFQTLCFTTEQLASLISDCPVTSDLPEAVRFSPDIVFCPGNYVHDAIGGIKVQLFHGLGYEKRGHFRIRGFFQVYCTPGPLITGKFQKLAHRHKSFLVRETGWPKTDLLFQQTPRPKALERVSPEKKIILYAPTFSRTLTSVPRLLALLPALPGDNEFFVIKLHDLHDQSERAALKMLPADKFLLVDSPDIIPWIHASDMLISDTSSVVYEYALVKEKIVLIDPKQKKLPFVQCSASQLRAAMDRVLYHTEQAGFSVRSLMDGIHPYRDGCCAQRIIDMVNDDMFMHRAYALPRKRNVFRRLKLRYYDRFKKGYVK